MRMRDNPAMHGQRSTTGQTSCTVSLAGESAEVSALNGAMQEVSARIGRPDALLATLFHHLYENMWAMHVVQKVLEEKKPDPKLGFADRLCLTLAGAILCQGA